MESTRVVMICLPSGVASKKGSKKYVKGGGVSIYQNHIIYSKKIKVKEFGHMLPRDFQVCTAF